MSDEIIDQDLMLSTTGVVTIPESQVNEKSQEKHVSTVVDTARKEPDPLQSWNSPMLLKLWLEHQPEPVAPLSDDDNERLATRVQLFKLRIRELESRREAIAPHKDEEVNSALAGMLFKQKYHNWLLFPINRLAPEILTMIFRLVIYGDTFDSMTDRDRNRMTLTWTCRLWRFAAIGDPFLWSSIWIKDTAPWSRSLTFLERSGSVCPLDIRINDPNMRRIGIPDPRPPNQATLPRFTRETMESLLDVVLLKVSQIQQLIIVVEDMLPALAAVQKLRTCGPPTQLERLEIHRTGEPSFYDDPNCPELTDDLILCDGYAPKLRWLCLNGIPVDWGSFPAANLKILDLRRVARGSRPASDEWLPMLESIPNVYKLFLDGFTTVDEMDLDGPKVSLPNLRDLFVGNLDAVDAAFLLGSINAPGVRNLTLMSMQGEFGMLIETIENKFPEIRMLTVYAVWIDMEEWNMTRLLAWFRSMPKLEFYKIAHVHEWFCDALIVDPRVWEPPREDDDMESPQILCPKLKYFHFRDIPVDPVIRLVSSRARMGVPLDKVYTQRGNLGRAITADDERRIKHASDRTEFIGVHGILTSEETQILAEMERSQILMEV